MKPVARAFVALVLVAATTAATGCAAERKSAKEPAAAAAPADADHAAPPPAPEAPAAQPPQAQPGAYPPAEAHQSTIDAPAGGAGTTRAAAMARAGRDLEVAQRELDVAAGDCRNACRALGSMDRAAGHLCDLASGRDETRRCDDAREKVLAARERVKQTCGGCPGGPSVERSDPVPSTR